MNAHREVRVESEVLTFQRQATVHLRRNNLLACLFTAPVIEQIIAMLNTLQPPYAVVVQYTWDTFQISMLVQCEADAEPQLLVIASDAVYTW